MSTCQNSTTSEHFQKWPKNQGVVLALSLSIQSILRQSCSINHSFIIPSTDPPSHFLFIPPSTQYLIAWSQKLFAFGRLNGTGYLLDN